MTINERIKQRRKYLKLSVDDVAKAIGKNRATVYRYESSEIEDMPVSIIPLLANILECTPAYLMGWEETAHFTMSGLTLTTDENELVGDYRQLNTDGKDKAREYTSDLTTIEKYTASESDTKNKTG